MRIGLVAPCNRTSGLGLVSWDLFRNLPTDSVLAFVSQKGNEKWSQRQLPYPAVQMRKCNPTDLRRRCASYLDEFKPDVLLAVETWHSSQLVDEARAREVKLVLIPMHEVYRPGFTHADLFLCPNRFCYNKVRERDKVLWRLPIDARDLDYRQRTGRPRNFLHCHGYGYLNAKRQTAVVLSAFRTAQRPKIHLTIATQMSLAAYGLPAPDDTQVDVLPPQVRFADIYQNADVLVQPEAYAGYGRVPLEAMLQGVPVLTTAAPPMHELVTSPDLLIPYERTYWIEQRGGLNVTAYVVGQRDVIDAIQRIADRDIDELSAQARKLALKHIWTSAKRRQLLKLLKGLCQGKTS